MRKKYMFSFLVLFIAAAQTLFAQTGTITGKVSEPSGAVLPGVNIQVKGTTEGTASDFDGNYSIQAAQGDVLIFSFVGFANQEVTVAGTTIDITLQEDANELDEVVVTAFGIQKSTKELGYSITQVKTEDLDLAGQTSGVAALQGRVAGLQISSTSGTPGGGVDILIRGMSSMNPNQNNQPLIIIDGVSINNDTFSGNILPTSGSNATSSSEAFSFSSRSSDINPNDIESYNVLKGAAATALYGVRAANGAIIITTKKGKQGKAKVNISASTTFSRVAQTPEQQKVFRQGWYGRPEAIYAPETETGYILYDSKPGPYNFGPLYTDDRYNDGSEDEPDYIDLSNDRYYDPYDMFQTGINNQIDFNISGAEEKINYYFSVGNSNVEGVVPDTDFSKTALRFNGGYQVSDKFYIGTSVSYTNSDATKPTGGDKSVMSGLGYWSSTWPVTDFLNPDGSQRNANPGFADNPLYNSHVSSLTEDTNRWIGNINLSWNPAEWVNVNYTAQVDNFTNLSNRFVPPTIDVGTQIHGFIVDQSYNYFGLESNLLVTLTKDWTEKLHTSLLVGNSILDNSRKYYRMYGQNLNLPFYNHISNTQENFEISNSKTQIRQVGLFGEFKIDYDNKLFLSVTGRNDWDSTLFGTDTHTYFYPSVSLAYDVHSLFGEGDFFTFGKLRGSYAEVGNGLSFGQVGNYFYPSVLFPWGGVGGYEADRTITHPALKPERTKSWEVGADLRFFKNRLRIDYAYYTNEVHDAIFPTGTAPSTSILSFTRNSGVYETEGHELLVSGDVIRTDDFNWELIYNFSTTGGKVISLPEEITELKFTNDYWGDRIVQWPKVGDDLGQLYGYVLENFEGQPIITNGQFRTDFDERVKVGNVFPDYIMSAGSNFTYKNLKFNFLVEWKEGGDVHSYQRYTMNRTGGSEFTLKYRLDENGEINHNLVLDGVMEDPNNPGQYIPNTSSIDMDPNNIEAQRFFSWSTRGGRRSAEWNLQDASWVKLRNVSISYDFAGNFLDNMNIDNFTVTAGASNILLWTPFSGFDPESSDFGAGSNKYGVSGRSIPLTENYSFGVAIGF